MRPPPSAASTGARSQPHLSTITRGYVQQVPYPKDDAQTRHSQLGEYTGHPPPNSSHHTSFPPHQYTGPRVQRSRYQGNNICQFTVVLPAH